MHYYICSGLSPNSDQFNKHKIPAVIELLSVVIHILIKLRIWKQRKVNNQTEIGNLPHKANVLLSLEKESIADFTSNVVAVLALTSFSLLSIKINSLTQININEYPNYIYLYLFQMFCPSLLCFTVTGVNYMRHGPLRKTIWREAKGIYSIIG